MDSPRLLEIQIADDKGAPMKSVQAINAIEGVGLEGDRYATGKGSFSNSKPPRNIDRHISLIESEAIEAVRTQKNIDVTFADTRRNVLTLGIRLNDLVGKRFYIGNVLVEGVELCDPCARPGILSGKDDVKKGFKDAFEKTGGLRVRVLGSGEIHDNDPIRVEE